MDTRCDIIVVLFTKSKLKPISAIVRELSALSNARRIVAIVNNSAISTSDVQSRFAPLSGELTIRHHDNTGREFGAYQAGLDLLIDDAPDRLIFLNDTVGTHQFVSKSAMKAFVDKLMMRSSDKFIIGTLYASERLLELAGLRSNRWVRTNLFAMDKAALATIRFAIYQPSLEAAIESSHDVQSFFGSQVGPNLRNHIEKWLFSADGDRWFDAAPLSDRNAERMAGKARCILQEKYLSMRLDAAGVAFCSRRLPLIDALWCKIESRLSRFRRSNEKIAATTKLQAN
jgi:hypothetical protein